MYLGYTGLCSPAKKQSVFQMEEKSGSAFAEFFVAFIQLSISKLKAEGPAERQGLGIFRKICKTRSSGRVCLGRKLNKFQSSAKLDRESVQLAGM